MSLDERVPLDSDVWKIVRLHGIGLEQLDIYWHGAIQYLELRWKKHVFKVKRDAIAHALRTEGYTVRMTGKLSNLDDMKRELRKRYEKLKVPKYYRCKLCGKTFPMLLGMSKHLEEEHGITVEKVSDLARHFEAVY